MHIARANADVITCIKIHISQQRVGRDSDRTHDVLRRARQVADEIGKPVMVHGGGTATQLDEVLDRLVHSDALTRIYHARSERVLDECLVAADPALEPLAKPVDVL